MDLILTKSLAPFQTLPAEIVERKGIGHPDTLCDQLAEEISLELCRYYIQETGAVQHHNVDKVLLVGGGSEVGFGTGRVTTPIELIVSGRAILDIKGKIPIEQIVHDAAVGVFSRCLPRLDAEKDLEISIKIKPGSKDLIATFEEQRKVPLANDTSMGVGYAPFTHLEQAVLNISSHLSSDDRVQRLPALGSDIKIMGVRDKDTHRVTIAAATIGPLLPNKKAYLNLLEATKTEARRVSRLPSNTQFEINTADIPAKGSFYLTATGSSVEAGDDGMTGRGNRHTGLITPFRFMTLEAAAGKNPINHVGKLYNVLAMEIAKNLVTRKGIEEATCAMVSQIGKPITQPQFIFLQLHHQLTEAEAKQASQEVVHLHLTQLPSVWKSLLEGKYQLY